MAEVDVGSGLVYGRFYVKDSTAQVPLQHPAYLYAPPNASPQQFRVR